jgi:hypothetical protein
MDKVSRYELEKSVLTKREMSFYEILSPIATKHELIILIKIRIADFVKVKAKQFEKGSGFHSDFNVIAKKHVDFLLCNKECAPVLCIEVQDSTHLKKDRTARDIMVRELYEAIGLPLLEIWGWKDPNIVEEHIISKLETRQEDGTLEKEKPVRSGFMKWLLGG